MENHEGAAENDAASTPNDQDSAEGSTSGAGQTEPQGGATPAPDGD